MLSRQFLPLFLMTCMIAFAFFSQPICVAEDSSPTPPAKTEHAQKLSLSATPLSTRVDELIVAASPEFSSLAAPRSSDSEFVRRVYLDLTGMIPTSAQTRSFLADQSPEKRKALIDQLLASPQHARRMQYVIDEMLMERRDGTTVPNADWQQWLRESFQNNKPWDQLVLEVLSADGVDEKQRPAARFYLDRKFDIDLLTRDIGRVFLGVDLECAQCHDHPSIGDYLQRHYYGLSAFLKRSYLFTDPKTKKKVLGEKAEGDVKFTSVFTQEEGKTDPRLMDLPGMPVPAPAKELYIAKPSSKVRGIPAYSRRMQLAKAMIADDNVDFRRNIVNRLWALVMGRGLVEPLDIRHSENPPSHPEVLDLLAEEFLKHKYDVRWLIRELASTETYQRSSQAPGDSASQRKAAGVFACGLLKPLSPEQLAWSALIATDFATTTMQTQEAALLKAEPETADQKKNDPMWREATLHKSLKPEVDLVVAKFAGQGGQKTGFEATADQALFLINGPNVGKWLQTKQRSLAEHLQKQDSPGALADELYISILTRPPAEEESDAVTAYLNSVDDRSTAIREMAWALLSSSEFRFNH